MASGHGTIGILTKRRNDIHRSYVFTHMTVAIGATNDVVWTTRGALETNPDMASSRVSVSRCATFSRQGIYHTDIALTPHSTSYNCKIDCSSSYRVEFAFPQVPGPRLGLVGQIYGYEKAGSS